MNRQELAKKIYDIAHLTGEFKLRSGQISDEYFDKYRFEAQPTLLREIAKQMAPLIPAGTEVLAGLEMGGIPIATALSLETGLPCVFVRKEAKEYGTCKFAEGLEIAGKKVCIIEDVVTTGGQVVLSTADLRSIGAKVDHVLCVIHRGPAFPEPKLTEVGLTLSPLFKKSDF
ncbi:orotate phosphoribosyltransferase [Bdellovibrio svalbardensis]|uniref:Orotate phosphoribosyltransferase n=1 Tax=Bdellovibrio svalbardensis TaxID=2972972 RepID=A0ABT6DQ99_9BACT|nr:orotate phosphoribosyltransferase [Bdellovibrio svalbardensis]MDG0818011.1 orotate phosphoribosyltransferase [Bdellovibrio svalbardensis]